MFWSLLMSYSCVELIFISTLTCSLKEARFQIYMLLMSTEIFRYIKAQILGRKNPVLRCSHNRRQSPGKTEFVVGRQVYDESWLTISVNVAGCQLEKYSLTIIHCAIFGVFKHCVQVTVKLPVRLKQNGFCA